MTKLRKIKNVYQVFSNLHLKKDTRANVYPFVFISSSVVCIYVQYLLVLIKEDQNFIKGICHVINFDQWENFSQKYESIRVWLWLAYEIIVNNCCSRVFAKFIQTHKTHPTSLDKISTSTWKLLVILRPNFFCELNSLQNVSYLSLLL